MLSLSAEIGLVPARRLRPSWAALLVWTWFGSCSPSVVVADATAPARETAPSVATIAETGSKLRRGTRSHWFLPVNDYVSDPGFNPSGRTLSVEDAQFIQGVFDRASLELDAIQKDFSAVQLSVARRHVQDGSAEPYVAGESDTEKGDYAAVVVARFDESGPWLVRIPAEELPDLAAWQSMHAATRDDAIDQLRSLLSGDRVDRRETSK